MNLSREVSMVGTPKGVLKLADPLRIELSCWVLETLLLARGEPIGGRIGYRTQIKPLSRVKSV
jgi:hypothetical protein